MNQRRKFSREFKLAAVKRAIENGLTVAEVARELGIRDSLIRYWMRDFQDNGTLAEKSQLSASIEAENKRLCDENRQLKMECDILKKASAFFAKENG